MHGRFRFIIAVVLVLTGTFAPAQLAREVIVAGLNFPTFVGAPRADFDRLFVVERNGVIRIIDLDNNTILPTPFLDISGRVNTSGEGALYSIAFHPQYATNGRFFVFYTTDINPGTGFTLGIRVSRFTVSTNPNMTDSASETTFLEISKPSTVHNGGMLSFRPADPNHYLYISVGDGGNGCDPNERAQDKGNKRGKILRIDVDPGPGGDPDEPFVPASNPYVDASGDDAVWVRGLRNPYRFSFDRLTGAMYIGDVGQEAREEIDFLPPSSSGGENFGWDALEGSIEPPNCPMTALPDPDMLPPLHEYVHGEQGAAVTGGYVYRGADFPDIFGRYYFADFVNGNVWSCIPGTTGVSDLQDHTALLNPDLSFITSFGEDASGRIYIAELQGTVARIVSPLPDMDQDLLLNEYEDDTGTFVSPTQTGTDPLDFDTDDDGVWDGIEVTLGTDPNDPFDFPELPAGWLALAASVVLAGSAFLAFRRQRRS